ncbi:MAG: large conductance mechanosensitive channel protein MscL [Saprospiraceae bacterium]|nr:large conductance mechanosensitive channel protein MscL [Candidatus Vicinibacter affinis]
MFKEFKEFALKGNLIDIAVGLVIATAFTGIVNAFVDGMFMPLVAKIFQIGDFKEAKIVLDAAEIGADGKILKPENAIYYGSFFSAVINFFIIAFVMFSIVKLMNSIKKDEAPAPAGPSTESLLTEIRDLLSKK